MRQTPFPNKIYDPPRNKGVRMMFAPDHANGPTVNANCEIRLALRARRRDNNIRKLASGHWEGRD